MRKKKKKSAIKSLFSVLITVIFLAIIVIGGFKLYEIIERKIDEYNYPLMYTGIVYKYADAYNVPRSVVLATINTESGFDINARSSAGACGLMQLTPETFMWLASTLSERVDESDVFLPEINIKYGTYYISTLYDRFGSWETVYAAYNAGPAKVSGWLADARYSENGSLLNIPYEETRNHVAKLKKAREKYIELYDIGET